MLDADPFTVQVNLDQWNLGFEPCSPVITSKAQQSLKEYMLLVLRFKLSNGCFSSNLGNNIMLSLIS